MAAATGSITEFGNYGEARDQAVLDLLRPAYPTFGKDGAVPAVSPDGMRFKAVFPDGTTLASGNKGQANAIADFKKALEGKPKAQAVISSLMQQQGSAVRIMRLQSKTPTAPTDTRPNPPPS